MAASEESFDYPPMYDFPPFFTIQPSDETRMKQLEQWRKFILHWVQHNAAKEAMLVDVHSFPLFKNDRIHRKGLSHFLELYSLRIEVIRLNTHRIIIARRCGASGQPSCTVRQRGMG
eukprot:gb/GECG01003543.1/.p1 GENE.gb/GECG01003543.1/~~gb/GECG01003543.1/.p1  ORF type:complete len:117 (+),score=12.69 gb/GECG01003543.1/:1-351(+)